MLTYVLFWPSHASPQPECIVLVSDASRAHVTFEHCVQPTFKSLTAVADMHSSSRLNLGKGPNLIIHVKS